jgi:hypothetical protein
MRNPEEIMHLIQAGVKGAPTSAAAQLATGKMPTVGGNGINSIAAEAEAIRKAAQGGNGPGAAAPRGRSAPPAAPRGKPQQPQGKKK